MLGLLGPFVIPQPLCWRRTCGSVVYLGAVPRFPRWRREAGRARCLPVAALATAWQGFFTADNRSAQSPKPLP